jgi:hypothetical protein
VKKILVVISIISLAIMLAAAFSGCGLTVAPHFGSYCRNLFVVVKI